MEIFDRAKPRSDRIFDITIRPMLLGSATVPRHASPRQATQPEPQASQERRRHPSAAPEAWTSGPPNAVMMITGNSGRALESAKTPRPLNIGIRRSVMTKSNRFSESASFFTTATESETPVTRIPSLASTLAIARIVIYDQNRFVLQLLHNLFKEQRHATPQVAEVERSKPSCHAPTASGS
jgi:hypothetical protein